MEGFLHPPHPGVLRPPAPIHGKMIPALILGSRVGFNPTRAWWLRPGCSCPSGIPSRLIPLVAFTAKRDRHGGSTLGNRRASLNKRRAGGWKAVTGLNSWPWKSTSCHGGYLGVIKDKNQGYIPNGFRASAYSRARHGPSRAWGST